MYTGKTVFEEQIIHIRLLRTLRNNQKSLTIATYRLEVSLELIVKMRNSFGLSWNEEVAKCRTSGEIIDLLKVKYPVSLISLDVRDLRSEELFLGLLYH